MSDSDSFIEEVTEEVRRDQLFRFFRKHGWIVGLAVVLVVGGAAFHEWRKASDRAAAQALGDSMLAALQLDNSDAQVVALDEVAEKAGDARVLALLQKAAAQINAGDRQGAAATLDAVAGSEDAEPLYRDLALLKLVMLRGPDMPDADRMAALDRLSTPGEPFRLLALEQRAIAALERNDRDAALADLKSILEDPEAVSDLRQRARRLTIALGGEPPPRVASENG